MVWSHFAASEPGRIPRCMRKFCSGVLVASQQPGSFNLQQTSQSPDLIPITMLWCEMKQAFQAEYLKNIHHSFIYRNGPKYLLTTAQV